eukprot:SAG11_NODE_373_length_10031_cov_37.400020_7_plen_61_part_00
MQAHDAHQLILPSAIGLPSKGRQRGRATIEANDRCDGLPGQRKGRRAQEVQRRRTYGIVI